MGLVKDFIRTLADYSHKDNPVEGRAPVGEINSRQVFRNSDGQIINAVALVANPVFGIFIETLPQEIYFS